MIARTSIIAALLAAVLGRSFAPAAETAKADRVPRFASLRSDRINLRVGPGMTYPILWVFERKDMPVKIIREFDHWRMIEDWQGTKGWVQESMMTDKRHVIVSGAIRPIYARPDPNGALIARAEPGVIAQLVECRGAWCRIEAADITGWVERSEIWGVFPDKSATPQTTR